MHIWIYGIFHFTFHHAQLHITYKLLYAILIVITNIDVQLVKCLKKKK